MNRGRHAAATWLLAALAAGARAEDAWVGADVARMRSWPRDNSQVITSLRINTRVTRAAARTAPDKSARWIEVSVPEAGLEGWMAAETLRSAPLSVTEARASATEAMARGRGAEALAWSDRLRALAPADPEALGLAARVADRFKDRTRAAAARQALAGNQPVYLAACTGERLIVVAVFSRRDGLQNLPAALGRLAGWIGTAAWHAAGDDGAAGMPMPGTPFDTPVVRPRSKPIWNKEAELWEDAGEAAQLVLTEGCGAANGPLATWPFRRIDATGAGAVPPAGTEAPDEPAHPCEEIMARSDPPATHDGDQDTTTVGGCALIELELGGERHRFTVAPVSNTQGAGSSSAWIEITHYRNGAVQGTVRVDLHNRSGC